MTKYAVYVHGYDLPMRDVDGMVVAGGLYAWRVVHAESPGQAIDAAIQAVRFDAAYIDEVIASHEIIPKFEAENVRVLPEDDDRRGTALIFYIDTEAPS